MKKILLSWVLLVSVMGVFGQSTTILPDSVDTPLIKYDTLKASLGLLDTLIAKHGSFTSLEADNLDLEDFSVVNLNVDNLTSTGSFTVDKVYTDSVFTDALVTDKVILSTLTGNKNSPVFTNANQQLSNAAIGFQYSIAAAAFIPEVISPIDNPASPLFGNIALNSGVEVQGYGEQYALIAPVSLSLNNPNNNIRITELEVCGMDRNANIGMWVELHETGINGSGAKTDQIKMMVKTTGSLNQYDCWVAGSPAAPLIGDFDLNQKNYSYWIKVYPRADSSLQGDPFTEFEKWPTLTSGNGVLKLLNVRLTYNHQ